MNHGNRVNDPRARAAKQGFTRRPRRNEATEHTEKESNAPHAKRTAVSWWQRWAHKSGERPGAALACRQLALRGASLLRMFQD